VTTSQPPTAAVDPLVGRVLDRRYRVEGFIARGGMATVYRGADLRLDRTVAIKVMHPSFATDPGFVDRFEREARAAARLNSPHVVGIFDQGNDAGITYLILEYVPGHTVRDVLRTHGALPAAQALAILEPVLEALAAAHRAGYVHRDVKPENVLISDDGRVKVADFGLARAIEGGEQGRSQGLLLGTVAYLSPEQVEHDRTDARSDVYSAGIMLYELVTCEVPYSASAPMQVAYKHVHEDVPAPSSVRADVPPEVDALVERATRRSPEARFGDAAEFLAEVRQARAAMPDVPVWLPSPHDTLVVEGARSARSSPDPVAAPVLSEPETASHEPRVVGVGAVAGVTAGALAGGYAPASLHSTGDGLRGFGSSLPPSPPDDTDVHATDVTHSTADDGLPKRRRRGRAARWLGLVALAAVAALLFVVFGPLQRVDVPVVTGRTPTEASAMLATANLALNADQRAFSEDYPAGQIISTDPPGGGTARSGSTIDAVVSRGPERYAVPELPGLTVEEAEVALSATNLELGATSQAYHDKVKVGDIISSNPKAGAKVKPGTEVAVVVSKGPAPVTIPDLKGVERASAEKQLKDLGLKVDRTEKHSETVPSGQVISTKPAAGATAHRGDTIDVVVSKGPPLVEVPNVIGMGQAQATATLQDAGFVVRVNKPFGTSIWGVRAQNPGRGNYIPKGSTVTITLV
jgi:serine/threonine-protein kinase